MLSILIKILSFTLQLGIFVNCDQNGESDRKWSHELTLSPGFILKWTTNDPIWLTMEMSAPTQGYVAIGFSPNGGMKGSDFVMGWVDDYGKGQIKVNEL